MPFPYKKDNLTIDRDADDVTKIVFSIAMNNENIDLITAKIDPHDNRVTVSDINLENLPDQTQKEAINFFCETFLANLGGKEFICLDKKNASLYAKIFEQAKFLAPDPNNDGQSRITVTTPQNIISNPITATFTLPDNFNYDNQITASDESNIIDLMKNSGFLQSKIDDYLKKGKIGVEVMSATETSSIFIIRNKEQKIVALARCSDCGNGIGYLCDTLVSDAKDVFHGDSSVERRAYGTALLYKLGFSEDAHTWHEKSFSKILLIAPPERVAEFKDNFNCTKLCAKQDDNLKQYDDLTVLCNFSKAKKDLEETYTISAKKTQQNLPTPGPRM